VEGAAQFAGRSGMNESADQEKGNAQTDKPAMNVEIGRKAGRYPSHSPQFNARFAIAISSAGIA